MAKVISFTFNDEKFTLEFTRKSVVALERQGFNITDISTKPASTLPALFAGAFVANHRFVKAETIDKIYESIKERQDLVYRLAEMYNDTIESLIDEPAESEGNVSWESNW